MVPLDYNNLGGANEKICSCTCYHRMCFHNACSRWHKRNKGTGEKRLFDTTLLQGSAFAPLADETIFSNPVLFHGVITWKNGEIDIAPETVYRDSYAYESMAV